MTLEIPQEATFCFLELVVADSIFMEESVLVILSFDSLVLSMVVLGVFALDGAFPERLSIYSSR